MIPLVLPAAVRVAVLTILAWLCLALLRIRSPHQHKSAWTAVFVVALDMLWLMSLPGAAAIHAPLQILVLPQSAALLAPWMAAVHVFATTYLLVFILLLVRYLLGWARIWLIRRDACRIDAPWASGSDVRVSTRLNTPAVFAGTVLLPSGFEGWDADKRAAVLAHERCHVAERDSQRLWLANLHACLFWPSPVAWWLRRRLTMLAEETSDAAALAAVGDRALYAQILLDFACQPRTYRGVMSMSSHVAARIERILSETHSVQPPGPWRRRLPFAAVVPAALMLAALQLASHGTPSEKPHMVDYRALMSGMKGYYPAEAAGSGTEGAVVLPATASEYVAHHITFLTNRAPQSLFDFHTVNLDSVLFSVLLALVFGGSLYWAARHATSGVPGKFQNFVEWLVEASLALRPYGNLGFRPRRGGYGPRRCGRIGPVEL